MKKMIRTDLRRSLSIFLAAVLLLTTWAIVSPQDLKLTANAATIESRSYSMSASNSGDDEITNFSARLYYEGTNGGNSGNTTTASGSITGVPTKVVVTFTQGYKNNANDVTCTVTVNLTYAGVKLLDNAQQSVKAPQNAWGTGTTDRTMTFTVNAASTVASVGVNAEPSSFTAGGSPNSTQFKFYPADAYGKRLGTNKAGTPTVTLMANGEAYANGEVTTSLDTSGTYDVVTVTAPKMQNDDKLVCTLVVSYGSISGESASFTIEDPIYTHTLNANSGAIFDSDGNNISGRTIKQYYYSGISGGKWGENPNIGEMAKLPDHGERLGYTYKGMYSGSAQTSTNMSKWEKVNGQWTSTWTPTGTKLETTTRSEATTTWSAAWHANPCVVTLYDYRGAPKTWTVPYGTTLQSEQSISDAWNNHPDYETNTYTYKFSNWYIEEANVYQLDGTQTLDTASMYETASLSTVVKGDMSIRPKYIRKDDTYNPYHVTFMGTDGSVARKYEDYRYNAPVISAADGHSAPVLSIAADMTYTYTFAGWTPIAPSAGSYYLFDSPAEAQGACEEFSPVTCHITYYPVFYRTYIPYTVNFKYVPDGKAASDENASTDYENHSATYHWGEDIVIPNMRNELGNQYSYTYGGGRYSFTVWDSAPVAQCAGDATYTAVYGDYEPAKYTVSFVDTRGAYGTADEPFIFAIQENIVHGANADEITVPAPVPVDIDGYRYTFNGWTLNGAAATPVLTGITADAIYSATWRRTVLCDVEFYNGGEHIAGADLHNKTEGEPISYVGAEPQKAPDKIADNYEWVGWLDADGNEVTAIPGGATLVRLYANYEIHYHNYTVTFKNDIGDTILEKTDYHYGDDVVEPTELQRAKAADETYNYTFTRWDKPVTDVEDDAVYTAVYLSHYNYYEVKWLNDDGSIYTKSNYIYNERISVPFQEPSKKLTYDDPEEGFTIGFLGWQNQETEEFYSRSDRCGTAGAVYIAKFGPVADLKTITFFDETGEGTPLGAISVEYNSTLADNAAKIPTAKKAADSNKHYEFDKWVKLDGTAFADTTLITDDVSLKASFASETHTFKPKSITTPPTFDADGSATEACDVCGFVRDVTVPALTDGIAPTAKLMVRDLSWTSDALDTTVNQVAPGNLVAIATQDKAEESLYNPSGDGSLVQKIQVVIAEEDAVREIESIADNEWFDAYTRGENDTGNANTADILGIAVEQLNAAQAGNIEHGDKFVIYVKAVDAKGNTTYVRSSVLQYDTVAPDLNVGVDGEFFNDNRTIFCGAATIEVDTDAPSYTLTVNNTIVSPSNNKYRLADPGFYAITVKDVAGNATTRNIEIKADHSYSPVSIAPTCEQPGSTYSICSVCGNRTEPQETPALGHDTVSVTVDPTCTTAGYTYEYCRRCNSKIGENTDIVPAFNHTYPNNAETYGEDAGKTAWKENENLRRNPTCSATGSAYYVCQLCGEQETRELAINPDAHNYYRGVTTDPTCTVDGFITYTCRYNSEHKKTQQADDGDYAYLKATGHTPADEWTIETPATCAAAGSRVKKCENCEAVLDETREVIPALEPHYVAHVIEPTDTTGGYTDYICDLCNGEVAGHRYQGDYVDPLTRSEITFMNGDEPFQTLSLLKGEVISEADVGTPTKASDDTYNYTFAGWVDDEEQPVTFPITVGEDDVTYTATYTERFINYTLILTRLNGEVFKKLGYQHNDDSITIDLTVGPKKESSETTDYTFDGWYYTTVVDGESVSSEVFTSAKLSTLIAAGIFNDDHEATLYPHYAETAREYTVVFGYDTNNILATVKVNFGETAVYPADADDPEKAFDELGHYAWTGWSADLNNVVQNLFVKPVFTKEAHELTGSDVPRVGEAQCTEPAQTKFTCDCGYTYTATTAPAPGHTWSAGIDGVQTCSVCGAERADQTLYTITFMVDGTKYKSYSIKYGETFSKPADPTKASDGQFTYAFAYWYTTDDETAVEVNTTCSGNITYYAKFNATERLFSVAFGYDANNIIETHSNVPYGTGVTYGGTTPVKASDATYHYTFTGWNKDTSSVTENMNVYALFEREAHSFDSGTVVSEANCQHAKTMKYTCPACGYSYTKEVGSKLNHNWVEKSRVNPTATQDGKIIYECSICHNQKEETLSRIFLKVTVKDQNGNPVSGVTVKVYDGNTFIGSDVSNGSGVATIVVPEAKTYRIEIEGRSANVTVDQNGNITGGSVPTVERNSGGNTSHGCDCTCHKSGLWPTIFRFFHKIIKLITGEFRCCPDAHY